MINVHCVPPYRFLVAIPPAPAVSAEVERLRSPLFARIGSFSNRHDLPHITLCFLDLSAEHEPAVLNDIKRVSTGLHGFTPHYQGVTLFPGKRTIWIDPVEKDAIVGALTANPELRSTILDPSTHISPSRRN